MERERRKAYSSYRDDFIYNISDFEESTFYFDDFSSDSDVEDALIDEEEDLLDQEDLFNDEVNFIECLTFSLTCIKFFDLFQYPVFSVIFLFSVFSV